MKVVDFDTFVRLPSGTIFAPYTPCCLLGEMEIKVDGGHPYKSSPCSEGYAFNGTMALSPWLGDASGCLLIPGDTPPASFEIYDGCDVDYRDYKLFLIFEDADVERLIRVLEWARSGCEGPNPGEVF